MQLDGFESGIVWRTPRSGCDMVVELERRVRSGLSISLDLCFFAPLIYFACILSLIIVDCCNIIRCMYGNS